MVILACVGAVAFIGAKRSEPAQEVDAGKFVLLNSENETVGKWEPLLDGSQMTFSTENGGDIRIINVTKNSTLDWGCGASGTYCYSLGSDSKSSYVELKDKRAKWDASVDASEDHPYLNFTNEKGETTVFPPKRANTPK